MINNDNTDLDTLNATTNDVSINNSDSCNNDSLNNDDVSKDTTMVKKNHKKKTFIFVIIFSIFFAVIGAAGGYIMYNWFNKKTNNFTGAKGEVVTEKDIKEIKQAIKDNNIETTYKDNPYKLINYSLDLEAKAKYSLVIGKGSATAMGITQDIESATFRTPDEIFNQNVSSSSFVKTANRYYDKKNNEVISYECKNRSDWKTANPSSIDYDNYITKFGKLLSGIYYCTTDENRKPINDKFLTLNKDEVENYDSEKLIQINSIIIYSLTPSTIKKTTSDEKGIVNGSSITKNDNGYQIKLALKNSGEEYYSVQMQTTGGLKSAPIFTDNLLTFYLDKNLNLISSIFEDSYDADIGATSVRTSQVLTQYYFRGDTPSFNGIEVSIPEITNEEFSGFSLFKDN